MSNNNGFKIGYRGSEAHRFTSSIHVVGSCWLWRGPMTDRGYPVFYSTAHKKNVRAHVWSWQRVRGAIPLGLEMDHKCRNRACVRPSHLEPVTHLENMRRSPLKNPTHCKRGHLFDEMNTCHLKRGGRACRACDRLRYYRGKR